MQPRVSILIPNFNNGRASARDGQTDFISILLESIRNTLADDPTPVEVIVYDDGSTDHSIDTLERWADPQWPGGSWIGWRQHQHPGPMIRLLQGPAHTGVLSIVANHLVQASSGDILVRLDGDTQILTPNWAEKLCQWFDADFPETVGPISEGTVGVIGPMQLDADHRVISYGDWIMHPKGYHHVASGWEPDQITEAIEVDHVMGAFYVCKREVYDAVGGYDELILRGQTIDFGLRARAAGYRCLAIPDVRFIHRHAQRVDRPTSADTPAGVERTLARFRDKWGFDRLLPELSKVRKHEAAQRLLWHPRFDDSKVVDQSNKASTNPWQRYTEQADYKALIDHSATVAVHAAGELDQSSAVLCLGHDGGLVTDRLAQSGQAVVMLDDDANRVSMARQMLLARQYPGDRPRVVRQRDARKMSFPDASVSMVIWTDALLNHPEPACVLREAQRVLLPEGRLVLTVSQPPSESSLLEADQYWQRHEIIDLFKRIGGFELSEASNNDLSLPWVFEAQFNISAQSDSDTRRAA